MSAAQRSKINQNLTVKTEPNVRIRIRGTIIRIQITEPSIRTIIRIRRQKGTRQPPPNCFQYFNFLLFHPGGFAVQPTTVY